MRNNKNIVILFIILLFFVGAFYLLGGSGALKEKIPENGVVVNQNPKDKINEINLVNKDRTIQLLKKNGIWTIVKPITYKTDKSSVDTILDKFDKLKAERLVEKNASDLSKYGLVTSKNSIEINSPDKKTTIIFGDTAPSGGYYFRLSDSKDVYKSDYDLYDITNREIDVFRDKEVLPFDPNLVTKVDVYDKGKQLFTVEKSGADWNATYPKKAKLNADGQAIVNKLVTIKVFRFIEDNVTDYSKYGLDKPHVTARMTTKNGKTYDLLVGHEKEQQAYYIKAPFEKAVATISVYGYDIRKDLESYLEK